MLSVVSSGRVRKARPARVVLACLLLAVTTLGVQPGLTARGRVATAYAAGDTVCGHIVPLVSGASWAVEPYGTEFDLYGITNTDFQPGGHDFFRFYDVQYVSGAFQGSTDVGRTNKGIVASSWEVVTGEECAQPAAQAPPQSGQTTQTYYNGMSLSYDPSLATAVVGQTAPRQESPDFCGFCGLPRRTEFVFQGYAVQRQNFNYFSVQVIPLPDYLAMAPDAQMQVDDLKLLLKDRPNLEDVLFGHGSPYNPFLPVLPLTNAGATTYAQTAYLAFQGGAGIRYITQLDQALYPLSNDELFYKFVGLSDDGQYLVSGDFSIRVALDPLPAGWQQDQSVLSSYNVNMRDKLNQTPSDQFSPSLDLLDGVIKSLNLSAQPPAPPTPTPVPPTPTPDLSAAAQPWIGEKTQLVNSMESIDVPAGPFTVPAVHAYDETASRQLLERVTADLQSGTLTQEEIDSFARLTLEERALSKMLPPYTSVAATLSDTATDSAGVILGLLSAMKPIWQGCSKIPFLCNLLKSNTEEAASNLLDHAGELFVRAFASSPDDADNASDAWHMVATGISDGLDADKSIKDLLTGYGIQAAGTRLLIGPYLRRSQQLIDHGVRTADLSSAAQDKWPITASTERASISVDGYANLADIQVSDAQSRATDFKKGASVTSLATDISDLATLSPFAAVAAAVSVGARIEHLAVNTTLYFLNARNLGCVEYLSTRAATSAFDAQHPAETCENRSPAAGTFRQPLGFSLAAHVSVAGPNPLLLRLQDQTTQYQQAVQALVDSTQSQDEQAAAQALSELSQVQSSMDSTLGQSESILLSRPSLDANAQAALDQSQQFRADNLALYLSVAEHWMATQAGQQPKTDLQQVAQTTISHSQQLQQTVARANPVPPVGQPHLLFTQFQTSGSASGPHQAEVVVKNVGSATAADARISVIAGTSLTPQSTPLGAVAAGQELHRTLLLTLPAGRGIVTVQVWAGNQLMDVRQLVVSAQPTPSGTPAGPSSTPIPVTRTEVSGTSSTAAATPVLAVAATTSAPDSTPLLLVIAAVVVGVLLLVIVLLFVALRRRAGTRMT